MLINLENRVPQEHPLRTIKKHTDEVLRRLSPQFDALYADEGRPSIPPEQLLKARILMALFSVRSERLFCEQLGYNLLWLWFLDRALDDQSWDHSVFAQNQERLLSAAVAQQFFHEVYRLSREQGWTSDAHFTADGTLIESWASLKSFLRKDGTDARSVEKAKEDDSGNPTIDFRGQKRTNDTHQSTTDPHAVLYKKAAGRESRLCFGGQVLMENRHGLCADITIHNPIAGQEPAVALEQLASHRKRHRVRPKTVGGDKRYHEAGFVRGCRRAQIAPHVSEQANRQVAGLDGRTTKSRGYAVSVRVRKRVEEIFGWMKTVGGLRRTRYRGIERTQGWAYFVASAYNLVRMARLTTAVVSG